MERTERVKVERTENRIAELGRVRLPGRRQREVGGGDLERIREERGWKDAGKAMEGIKDIQKREPIDQFP